MRRKSLKNELKDLLEQASPYRDQTYNRDVCQQFCEALAATRPDQQLRDWQWMPPLGSRYCYLFDLAKLKVTLMRGDWYQICSALQDVVHFHPVTFRPIRECVLAALEDKLQENTAHETDG